MDHHHKAGVTCSMPGCGDPEPRVAAEVDRVLRAIPAGKMVPRAYVYGCVAAEHDDGPDLRGPASTEMRRMKNKSASSRGSRTTQKARLRLLRLAEAGAIEMHGSHMISVVDMNIMPPLTTKN